MRVTDFDALVCRKKDGQLVSAHWLKFPADTENNRAETLRQYRSLAFFKRREADHVFAVYTQSASLQMEVDLGIYKDLPTYQHNCLWELYKAMGYDYQKQRFV